MFKIHAYKRPKGCPESVPWKMVAPYEAQAIKNHGQSLERLSERGGLDARELYWVMNGMGWRDSRSPSEEECVQWIVARVNEFNRDA